MQWPGICYKCRFILQLVLLRPRHGRLFSESLSNGSPVDNLPDGAKVLGLAVLVLQIVGVLPGVDAQQGLKVAGDGVLVGTGDKTKIARGLVLDEPGPAGALDASEGSVGLLLEVLEGAKVLVNGGLLGTPLLAMMACDRREE